MVVQVNIKIVEHIESPIIWLSLWIFTGKKFTQKGAEEDITNSIHCETI